MKVREATAAELAPKPRADKPLTPRQLAALKRDKELVKAFERAEKVEVVAIELDATEKLPTVRAAIRRLWMQQPWNLYVTARGTTIYVSKTKLPNSWKFE